jgi:hypothetical protein
MTGTEPAIIAAVIAATTAVATTAYSADQSKKRAKKLRGQQDADRRKQKAEIAKQQAAEKQETLDLANINEARRRQAAKSSGEGREGTVLTGGQGSPGTQEQATGTTLGSTEKNKGNKSLLGL